MRTKTTVLAAAVLAAGALSSMAQNNVYSLNVVGYINVAIPVGYSLVANQLNASPDNTLNNSLGLNFPSGLEVIKWDAVHQGFTQPDTFYTAQDTQGAASWLNNLFTTSTTTVSPGEGFFFYNPNLTATNVTLVGQVVQGTNALAISVGYSFLSVVPPVAVDLSTNGSLALPITGAGPSLYEYITFNSAAGGYSQPVTFYDTSDTQAPNGQWLDNTFTQVPIIPAVGQGFVIYNPNAALTWVNTFSVQ